MNLIKKLIFLNGAALTFSGSSFYTNQASAAAEDTPDTLAPIEQNINPENSSETSATEVEDSHMVEEDDDISLTPSETSQPIDTEKNLTFDPAETTPITLQGLPDVNNAVLLIDNILGCQTLFHSSLLDMQQQIAAREHAKIRQLMTLTCSLESTIVKKDDNGLVHSLPIKSFYFCSSNALTIGYGTKIEYQDGKLCKEGVEMLELLDIKRNGRSLTMAEKEEMVHTCFARRNAYDEQHSVKLCELKPEAQRKILFNDDDYGCIDGENARDVAQHEYTQKMHKLLEANKYLGSSYLLLALATDFAYQYGNNGVRSFDIYKVNGPITLSKLVNASSLKVEKKKKEKNIYDDRHLMRRLILDMAIQNARDKKARGGKLATPESQGVFYMQALQKFTEMFNHGIMNREPQKILLMEQFMTLVMMQCMHNVTGQELTQDDLKIARTQAHKLVYDELFHSEVIQQLPEQIRPITLTSAIGAIKISELKSEGGIAMEELRKSILAQAQERLKRYNKKNKSNHEINIAAAYNLISRNDQSRRW